MRPRRQPVRASDAPERGRGGARLGRSKTLYFASAPRRSGRDVHRCTTRQYRHQVVPRRRSRSASHASRDRGMTILYASPRRRRDRCRTLPDGEWGATSFVCRSSALRPSIVAIRPRHGGFIAQRSSRTPLSRDHVRSALPNTRRPLNRENRPPAPLLNRPH